MVQARLEGWRGSINELISTVDTTLGVRREGGGARGGDEEAAAPGSAIVIDDDDDGLVVEPVAVGAH
jgi:hypothetical protein